MNKKFTCTYIVSTGDINYGGHLGNDRPLVIFQDARIRFLGIFGLSEMDIGEEKGIIMVESGVRYLREIFLHEVLTVEVEVEEIRGKKCTLFYSVYREPEKELTVTGFTAFLAFKYGDRKVTKFPEKFLDQLSEYQKVNQ